tara:strand:- start:476 stop:1141 length:666 start_codon:yes stop_codon:yes gene_type:complete
MRTALAKHLGEFVLVQATVDTWFNEEHAIRVFVRNPVIKKGNKDLLFKDQELISKEHHLNLFAEGEEWRKKGWQRYEKMTFGGDVYRYVRADGTIDFGVRSTPTTMLHFKLQHLEKQLYQVEGKFHGEGLLMVIDEFFLPKIKECLDELKGAGDRLPTWVNTYSEYLKDLNRWKNFLDKERKILKGRLLQRDYRRFCKRREKKWGTIFSREMKKELTLINN